MLVFLSFSLSDDSYTVIDYALRDQIWVGSCQPEDLNLAQVRSTTSMLSLRQAGASHLFRLHFRSNHSGDTVSMILGTELLWVSNIGTCARSGVKQQVIRVLDNTPMSWCPFRNVHGLWTSLLWLFFTHTLQSVFEVRGSLPLPLSCVFFGLFLFVLSHRDILWHPFFRRNVSCRC